MIEKPTRREGGEGSELIWLKLKIYVEKLLQSGWKDWIKIMEGSEGCAKNFGLYSINKGKSLRFSSRWPELNSLWCVG